MGNGEWIAGTAPRGMVFIRAAELLLESTQALLQAGQSAADIPLLIEAALQQARQQWSGDPDPVLDLLSFYSPEELLGLVQGLMAPGVDLEGFLAQGGEGTVGVPFPPLMVSAGILAALQQRLDLETGEQEILSLNLEGLQKRLGELAAQRGIPETELVRWQERLGAMLAALDGQQLWQAAMVYLEEEENLPPPPPTVAGPILYLEVSEYLLSHPDLVLTPEQRLDLQLNAGRAEARLAAMDRLGKIPDPEAERQLIRAWMQQQSPQDLLSYIGLWFPTQV
ncbi:MAG: hypothetical protein Q6K70_04755 [Thermostichales cyanobacterium DRC_bins_46]